MTNLTDHPAKITCLMCHRSVTAFRFHQHFSRCLRRHYQSPYIMDPETAKLTVVLMLIFLAFMLAFAGVYYLIEHIPPAI